MKYRILKDVPQEKLAAKVGKKYKYLPTLPEGEKCTLIFFRGSKQDGVILSTVVAKAIENLGERNVRAFAIADQFTKEAHELLAEYDIEPVHGRDFGWTDASWRGIISR